MKITKSVGIDGTEVYDIAPQTATDEEWLERRLCDGDAQDARIRSLEHDHKLMREALEKYSDNGHWQSDGLWCDHGETARTALDKLEVKDE